MWMNIVSQRKVKVKANLSKMSAPMALWAHFTGPLMSRRSPETETKMERYDLKVDDELENISRRCNMIIFNLPEKAEGQNYNTGYVCELIKKSGMFINPLHIQSAHRMRS